MNYNRLRFIFTGLFALVIAFSTALGQGVNTGGFSGFVTDKEGKPVAGATVTALHVPSGTRSTAVTRSSGQYDIGGTRLGGPYTVSVSGNGFTTQEQSGLNLVSTSRLEVSFSVSSDVVQMSAVTVQESRDTTFAASAMGTGINIGGPDILSVASVHNDLSDLMNLDPRVTIIQAGTSDESMTISVQGQNPKENLILVDGVSATDNFGLNSNGYAGLKNPIPFPWIESFSFKVNEYDAIYSGFLGGITDITLKSGTNQFHGSLYAQYAGTSFRGPDPVVGVLGPHEPMQAHTTGITLGGPIIKDKLFFFMGFEDFREVAAPPPQQYLITDPQLPAILAKAASYGYNPGTFVASNTTKSQNFVGKIDWNISDAHKFEFTFRHTAGTAPNFYNYTGSTQTSLSSSWYDSNRIDQSYTAKFNSDWSKLVPGLRTEIESTYKKYNGTAKLEGTLFPAIQLYNVTGTSTVGASPSGQSNLFLGTYASYQLNNLYTQEQEEHLYAEYSTGNHTFKFGAQIDKTAYTDTFIPNYVGTYFFSNVGAFLNGTPTGVTLATAANGYKLSDDVAHYYLMDIAPLVQDTWTPNSQLSVLAGVRMDYPYQPGAPLTSPVYVNAYGTTNATTMNGNYTISPRLGFNYSLPTQRKTQIRGGIGLFLGQNPAVWLENSFANAGQLNTYTISNGTAPIPNYTFTGNPSTQPLPPVAAGTAVPTYNLTDPNFHWPANYKENIAIDHELPFWHLILTVEADFSQVQKDVTYRQTNLKQAPAGSGPVYMPDGAIRYAGNITPTNIGAQYYAPGYTNTNFYTASTSQASTTLEANTKTGPVYLLTNTNKGGTQEYTVALTRPMTDNWSMQLAYTHTHATQVDYSASAVASTNFLDKYYVNPNDDVPYRSQFAAPDKIVLNTSIRLHLLPYKNTTTTLSAQFIAQTGQAYSYVFRGDADGAGGLNQNLFYVPAGASDPKVTWASDTEKTAFFQWLGQNPELAKYAGKIAPRNAFYAPWQKTVNLHLEQNVPVYGPGRLVLFADCYNFANLLNNKWGIVSNYNSATFATRTVAGTGYLSAGNNGQGQYVYVFNPGTLGLGTPSAATIYPAASRWAVNVGARLEF